MKLMVHVIIQNMPLIYVLIGGMFMPAEKRREILYWVAEHLDCSTRRLHELVADELDSLSTRGR